MTKKVNIQITLLFLILNFIGINAQNTLPNTSLPRAAASKELTDSVEVFLARLKEAKMDIHSLMIVKDGNVLIERWFGEWTPVTPHELYSVSKTFTSTAIGFAVAEGKLKVTDKVVSFFPDLKLETISPYLEECEVRHLLTMSTGIEKEVDRSSRPTISWEQLYLEQPMVHKPGTHFCYSSLGSHMLSSIFTKATGQKMADYLDERLFKLLGISNYYWGEKDGITYGGFGLFAKTEDMAKLGLFYLQKGKWNGVQLLPESWIEEATQSHIIRGQLDDPESDWEQGYGYQIWRCRHNAFRADGANGQYIIMMPDQNVVIAVTANLNNMQKEINFVWDHLLPAL